MSLIVYKFYGFYMAAVVDILVGMVLIALVLICSIESNLRVTSAL